MSRLLVLLWRIGGRSESSRPHSDSRPPYGGSLALNSPVDPAVDSIDPFPIVNAPYDGSQTSSNAAALAADEVRDEMLDGVGAAADQVHGGARDRAMAPAKRPLSLVPTLQLGNAPYRSSASDERTLWPSRRLGDAEIRA